MVHYRTHAATVIGAATMPVDVRVSTEDTPPDSFFACLATIVVKTGASYTQSYATAEQCRAIARSLMAAAADLEAMAADHHFGLVAKQPRICVFTPSAEA